MTAPEITTLKNGLRVASLSIPRLQAASLGVWVDTGARYEAEENNGIAHFLEHMAFKGTRRRTALQIAEEFDAIGGNLNAYTSMEHTVYYAKVLGKDVPLAVDMMADILQHSQFDQVELDREREVVLQEVAMHHDTPDDLVFDYFHATAYPGQPLGRSILGTVERIKGFGRKDLNDFMGKYYAAQDMLLVAAGNVRHEELVALAEKHFTHLKPQREALKPQARYAGGDYRKSDDLEQLHLLMGFEGVSYMHDDYYAMQLLSTVLGGGMSSRLFQEVREKRGLAYSISAFLSSYVDTGVFSIYAGTGEKNGQELLAIVCDELRKLPDTLSADEFERAKNQLRAGLLMSRESSSSEFDAIGRYLFTHGRYVEISEIIRKVEAVTEADLRRVLANMLARGKPTFAALGPMEKLTPYEKLVEMVGA